MERDNKNNTIVQYKNKSHIQNLLRFLRKKKKKKKKRILRNHIEKYR